MLDPPVCVGVSNCCPVYSDVVVITKVQKLLSGELGVVVRDVRVGDPNTEDNVLDKAYHLLGANFGHGPSLDPLSELVDHDKQVGEVPRRFLKGTKRSRLHTVNGHVMGVGLEFLG
jgi:hypothetical protein